jgi:hypothetical protein
MSAKLQQLKIDDEFKRLIPPLSAEERKQLEENILKDGCRDSIVVWNGTIVDGHNRYEICTRNEILFATRNILLRNREEAIAWICANQLGRRNISDETRRYLIGKRYEVEKSLNAERNAGGTNQYTGKEVCAQIEHKPKQAETAERTSERLGSEYRLGAATVRRYGACAKALDAIAQAAPELHKKLLAGQVKMTQDKIIEISKLPTEEIQRIEAELPTEPTALIRYMDARGMIPKNTPNKVLLEQMQLGGIKKMPKYNPDAEVTSLLLTVPSWESSIRRVLNTAKFNEVSADASKKLAFALIRLKLIVDKVLAAIEEEFK